ncbi:MAG: hypothetical protein JEZ04_12035 [Spirochaetales bacterium]|nr:hypothetical protein [Spirochaetales bacterium]
MDYIFPISAGFEKFYTVNQFYTVSAYTLSLLLTVFLMVFISSHMERGRQKRLFIFLIISFSVFQIAEIALSVAPAFSFLRFWLIVSCTSLFIFSRLSFLFYDTMGIVKRSLRVPLILIFSETFIWLIAAAFSPADLCFFNLLSFHRIDPGVLFWLFLADSIGWMISGMIGPAASGNRMLSVSRPGYLWFSLGVIIFCIGLVFNHIVFSNIGSLILPSASLLLVLCWRAAFIRRNLLQLYLESFTEIIDHIQASLIVIDRDGRIIAVNGMRFEFPEIRDVEQSAELAQKFSDYMTPGSGEEFLRALRSRKPEEVGEGRFTMSSGEKEISLSYAVSPVLYWRKSVAWMLLFIDVTEEEKDIRILAAQEEEVSSQYGELTLYRNTGMYLEMEKKREALIGNINFQLAGITEDLQDRFIFETNDLAGNKGVDYIISGAREGLSEIRASVNRLKLLRKGGMQ